MKALVTGATGFVGGHLAEALRRQGAEVTALVRSPAKATHLGTLGVHTVAGDLHHLPALREAVRDQDVIYHVAGLVAARDEAEFLHGNREGTRSRLAAFGWQRGDRGRRLGRVRCGAGGGPGRRGAARSGYGPAARVSACGCRTLAG